MMCWSDCSLHFTQSSVDSESVAKMWLKTEETCQTDGQFFAHCSAPGMQANHRRRFESHAAGWNPKQAKRLEWGCPCRVGLWRLQNGNPNLWTCTCDTCAFVVICCRHLLSFVVICTPFQPFQTIYMNGSTWPVDAICSIVGGLEHRGISGGQRLLAAFLIDFLSSQVQVPPSKILHYFYCTFILVLSLLSLLILLDTRKACQHWFGVGCRSNSATSCLSGCTDVRFCQRSAWCDVSIPFPVHSATSSLADAVLGRADFRQDLQHILALKHRSSKRIKEVDLQHTIYIHLCISRWIQRCSQMSLCQICQGTIHVSSREVAYRSSHP